MKRFFIMTILMLLIAVPALGGQEYGVYVKAVEKAETSFDEVVGQVENALLGAGWEVIASYESGVDGRCGMRAHVVVANNAEYAGAIMKHGADAAFVLPLKVGVYEDESGIHVAFANPASIARTVLGDGVEDALAVKTMDSIAGALGKGVKGTEVKAQAGEIRDEGRVGGMGGGDFKEKVETIHSGGAYDDVVAKVQEGIKADQKGWKLVYTLKLDNVTLIGLTSGATEAKAFDIAGDSRESKTFKCPGLDHAAAFPIEVVVSQDGGEAKVVTLDEMYRMKVYFEDAGNWAFMKNMTMPGRIEDEIVEAATSKLK